MKRLHVLLVAGFIASASVLAGDVSIPKGPCGTKPPAEQQRRKGGEGVPPLPLPATPLRRTERKRQPSPPTLIAKIQHGTPKEIKIGDQTVKYNDWDKDPGDVKVLLTQEANPKLNVTYTVKKGPLSAFPPDPSQYPIFYYSGSEDFTLTDAEIERLREFIRAGGMVWGETAYGDPEFFQAFVREMGKVLPDRKFHRLAADHPMFTSFHDIKQVSYTRAVPDAPKGEPIFYGMDIGCRTAIILSRYGLCCGWDGHIREGAFNVHPKDARALGVNMIAYALATHGLGIYQSVAKNYYQENAQDGGGFVFAQAKVGENWDCQTNNIANLLKAIATKSSAEVKFDRNVVSLGGSDVMNYPFLYVTGHGDFRLSEAEITGLKNYLASGGFLLASPCCGSREFDAAFRRELDRALPECPLQPLPAEHPVYSILSQVDSVSYSAYATSRGEPLPPHPLEGMNFGGTTSVIYCPYGLGGGWRGFDHPFGRDIASEDSLELGVNIVLYALTH